MFIYIFFFLPNYIKFSFETVLYHDANWKFRFCELQNDLFNIAAQYLPSLEIIPTMSTRSIEYTEINIEIFREYSKYNWKDEQHLPGFEICKDKIYKI